jgi:hypothetical protein
MATDTGAGLPAPAPARTTPVEPGWMSGILLVAVAIAPVFLPDAALWLMKQSGAAVVEAPASTIGERILRWSLSLVPSAVILHHALYLLYFRQRQFPTESAARAESEHFLSLPQLKQLYFGGGSIGLRYIVPLLLTGALCSTMMAALLDVRTFSSWLSGQGGGPIHRAASLGLVGAYMYVILLLTQRAFRQDVTTGVALWTAAMFVIGPVTAGVFALFWKAPGGSTVAADVVYLVAGMLPRQFASMAQGFAQRMLQPSRQPAPLRSVPLTMVRGINADVEERLSEEGIFDVATLAYADAYLLLQSTSFDRRQIVNWIDEALLITVFPDHWQAIQKHGFTGAMDLAWTCRQPSLTVLAAELKMDPSLLRDAATRLAEDPQVQDLYAVYWDVSAGHPRDRQDDDRPAGEPGSLHPVVFTLVNAASGPDIEAILNTVKAVPDVARVERVDSSPHMWRAYVRGHADDRFRDQLRALGLSVE